MPDHVVTPAKMLVCFTRRRRGERLVAAAKAAGARGGTIALGRSLGDNRLLRALSLADIQVDVVFIVMTAESDSILCAIRGAAAAFPKKLGGTALVMDVPAFFLRSMTPSVAAAPLSSDETRSSGMESGYTLINVIVNAGCGDDVIAEARKAGATGGTILNARGTGTKDDVKFFGINLVPEKEMLLIAAKKDMVDAIVKKIGEIPTLRQPGGGVIFNMNIEQFIILGG